MVWTTHIVVLLDENDEYFWKEALMSPINRTVEWTKCRRSGRLTENIDLIRTCVAEEPKIAISRRSEKVRVSKPTICRILRNV